MPPFPISLTWLHVNDAQLQAATATSAATSASTSRQTHRNANNGKLQLHRLHGNGNGIIPMDATSVALADFVDLVAACYAPKKRNYREDSRRPFSFLPTHYWCVAYLICFGFGFGFGSDGAVRWVLMTTICPPSSSCRLPTCNWPFSLSLQSLGNFHCQPSKSKGIYLRDYLKLRNSHMFSYKFRCYRY